MNQISVLPTARHQVSTPPYSEFTADGGPIRAHGTSRPVSASESKAAVEFSATILAHHTHALRIAQNEDGEPEGQNGLRPAERMAAQRKIAALAAASAPTLAERETLAHHLGDLRRQMEDGDVYQLSRQARNALATSASSLTGHRESSVLQIF